MADRRIETELVDLADPALDLDDVRRNIDIYRTAIVRITTQVAQPRANIGGTNPPGRAD